MDVFWAGGIRDRYADDRISNNEKETALAKLSAATATEEAAKPFKGLVDCRPSPDPALVRDIARICEQVAKEPLA